MLEGSPCSTNGRDAADFGRFVEPRMPASACDGREMDGIEQGWSHGPERQLWRFLARSLPVGRVPLRGRDAVASITFDDVPESAALNGAPQLERRGMRGTFYVAADLCGRKDKHWRVASRENVRDLALAGHEIGCHTARHVNVQSLRADALVAECELNRDMIAEITGTAPINFCYPFGDVGFRQKRVLGDRFMTCRTIYEQPNAGSIDPALLGAYGLFDSVLDRARIEALVQATIARHGWLIFYTHDVAGDPTPMGASPRLLAEALDVLTEHGVPVMTVAEAARHHGLTAAE